jgi:hypothetical protein
VGSGGFFFGHPICRERMYTCSTKYREEWYSTNQVPVVLSIVTRHYPMSQSTPWSMLMYKTSMSFAIGPQS